MLELRTMPRSSWSVFDELESLQEDMNRVFGGWQAGSEGRARRRSWPGRSVYPLLNVWSSAEGAVIDAELPGVDPKDVDISVKGDEVTLRGRVNTEKPEGNPTCHRCERPSGDFARTLQLPFRAEAGAVKAQYRNGLLRLTVPRSEEEKPKRIEIEAV